MILFFPAALAAALLAQGEAALLAQEDDAARWRRLVELLDSADTDVRRLAKAELTAGGRAALPAVREALLRRGCDEVADVLCEIYRRDPASGADERWVQDAWIDALRRRLAPAGGEPADAYVAARLREATAHFDEGRYEVAREMTRALQVLEPSGPRAGERARFQAACEQRIVDTRLVCARLEVDSTRIVAGEPVVVRLVLRNVSGSPIAVTYGLLGGRIVLQRERRLVDARNGEEVGVSSATIDFPAKVSLGPEESWQTAWRMDGSGEAGGDERARLYAFEAWSGPARIEAGGEAYRARLLFPPVEVRAVPEFARPAVENPELEFRRALEHGSIQHAFLAAFLIDGPEERMSAAECLARMLPEIEAAPRGFAYAILCRLTGETIEDTAEWLRWLCRREQARRP